MRPKIVTKGIARWLAHSGKGTRSCVTDAIGLRTVLRAGSLSAFDWLVLPPLAGSHRPARTMRRVTKVRLSLGKGRPTDPARRTRRARPATAVRHRATGGWRLVPRRPPPPISCATKCSSKPMGRFDGTGPKSTTRRLASISSWCRRCIRHPSSTSRWTRMRRATPSGQSSRPRADCWIATGIAATASDHAKLHRSAHMRIKPAVAEPQSRVRCPRE